MRKVLRLLQSATKWYSMLADEDGEMDVLKDPRRRTRFKPLQS